jgi:hypothetical protein
VVFDYKTNRLNIVIPPDILYVANVRPSCHALRQIFGSGSPGDRIQTPYSFPRNCSTYLLISNDFFSLADGAKRWDISPKGGSAEHGPIFR